MGIIETPSMFHFKHILDIYTNTKLIPIDVVLYITNDPTQDSSKHEYMNILFVLKEVQNNICPLQN